MKRISRGYNKRKFSHNRDHREIRELRELPVDHVQHPQLTMPQNVVALAMDRGMNQGQRQVTISKRSSPRSPMGTKTKKKGYFFESKSRGSKKLAKIIGK